MKTHTIVMDQDFAAPPERVFAVLSDHEELGRVLNTNIKRVRDASDDPENVNGVGSVRRIQSFGVPAFEETVTVCDPPNVIEYTITKGSPIKNHRGRLEFRPTEQGTHLHYTIEFQPKLNLPLWGAILESAIRGPIEKGLRKLARSYMQ